MGLYSSFIFPRLMDKALSGEEFQQLRRSALAGIQGEIFELGFGTGLNLPHYPPGVRRITTADPNPGARRLAERRIAQSGITVIHHAIKGESVPLADQSFESVACTFTLCSIKEVDRALQEMRRILKPGGRFYFLEHGLSDDPRVQWWQHRLTPIQRRIGDGCHLDRDAAALLRRNGFQIERLDNFYLRKAPRFAGYIYRGVATRAA